MFRRDLPSNLLPVKFNHSVAVPAVIQVYCVCSLGGILDFALMLLNLVPWCVYAGIPRSFSYAGNVSHYPFLAIGNQIEFREVESLVVQWSGTTNLEA